MVRIRIRRITLMRIRCLSGFFFYADSDPTFHPHADPVPYPGPNFQIKSQTLEKVLKQAYIPNILACRWQIDADPGPDPAYHFDADPDADPGYQKCGSGSVTLL